MLNDEEEILPPRDEEVPASLAKKWEEQEKREGLIHCPSCHKQILAASSFCVYCGEPVGMSRRGWVAGAAVSVLIILMVLGVRLLMK